MAAAALGTLPIALAVRRFWGQSLITIAAVHALGCLVGLKIDVAMKTVDIGTFRGEPSSSLYYYYSIIV